MGLILANFIYDSPPDAIIERSQFWGVSLGWWTHCFSHSGPNLFAIEVPFGGVRVKVGINPDFWESSSSAWRIDTMIDHIWAEAPGGGPPAFCGNVSLSFSFQPFFGIYIFNVAFVPNDGHYTVCKLPGILNSGWLPEVQPDLPGIFNSLASNPSQIYPANPC